MNILLYIFTLLMPLENRTSVWLNFGGGFNLTTIFTALLIIGWMISRRANTPSFIKSPLNQPVILFIVATYLSFFTGHVQLGIPFFGDEFRAFKSLLTIFILFFIIANNVKDKKTMKLLLAIMTFMTMLTTVIVQKEFRGADIWHYNEESRISVFGMQPNMVGAFMAQFLPILAAFAFLSKKFKNKILFIALFSFGLPGLMFTYSRGAYLSITGAIILMVILGGRKLFNGFVLLLLAAIFAQSILFGQGLVPVSVRERFEMVQGEKMEEDTSAQLRKEVWALAKTYIRESPIVGYGYGASDYLLYLENRNLQLDTHNMYLDIALECGIPTLLIFIWLLIRAFKVAFMLYRRTDDDFYKIITLGFMGSVVALAIGNLFGTRLVHFASNGYFAILMGMTARICYIEKGGGNVSKSKI